MKSRTNLTTILQAIEEVYRYYRHNFYEIYGKPVLETVTEKTLFEERLTTAMFIEEPIILIDSADGIKLSKMALKLLFMALTFTTMDPYQEYHKSLKCFPNLLIFWHE